MTGTAFPSSLLTKISRQILTLNENKAQVESVFTRKRQVVTLSGGTADRWEGVIETVPLSSTDVKTMWAFLAALGQYGEFTLGDTDYTGPASGATTGLVMGASQSGTSLIVDGVATAATILTAGEYFQVRDEFKIATANCVSSGGVVTLTFKPALRVSPADNDPVTFNTPKMLLQLLSMPSKDTDSLKMGIFQLPFQESIVTS